VGWLVAAGLIAVCVGLVLLPRRTVNARGLALFRSLFPSWRFFEEIEAGPSLSFCAAPVGSDFGPWRAALTPSPRGPTALLLNARGNLTLAYQSIVEQLASELDEAPDADPSTLISYQLVVRLVAFELLSTHERTPGTQYRFRIDTGAPRPFESRTHEYVA
jgi:hypothetical protein